VNKVVPQTDVYALGVVFYEMVTGRKPYTAETPAGILVKHSTEPLPRPRDLNPAIPVEVERVLYKALAKDPLQRYLDMGALTDALENLVQGARSSAPFSQTDEGDAKTVDYGQPVQPAPPWGGAKTQPSRTIDESSFTSHPATPESQKWGNAAQPMPQQNSWMPSSPQPPTPAEKTGKSMLKSYLLIGIIGLSLAMVILCLGEGSWLLKRRSTRASVINVETISAYAQETLTVMGRQTPTLALNGGGNTGVDANPTTTNPPIYIYGAGGVEKVGLVTDVGKVNDGTFNQLAYEGAKKAAEGAKVELNYIQTISSDDYMRNIETFTNEGYKHIVTVGFMMGDTTKAAAEKYPDINFSIVDFTYDPAIKNIQGLVFREDQAGFMAGVLAGQMTKSKKVGIVGGMEIPPVKKYRNGYESGVKYVCPNCKVIGVYIDSFTDPARGKAAAESQIAEGADVIFGAGGPTGSGGILGAAQQGVWVIGVDQDEYLTTFKNGAEKSADKLLSSAMKRVDVAVETSVKASANGTFQGGTQMFDAKVNGVGLAPFHNTENAISTKVKAKLNETYQKLADGSLETGVDPVNGDVSKVESQNGTSKKNYTFATIVKITGITWFNRMETGVKKFSADNPNVTAFQQGPDKADGALQVQIIEDLIAQKVDAINVVPLYPEILEPVLKKAMDNKIVVISHEAPNQQNMNWDIEAFSNSDFGAHIMDALAKAMGEEGTYAVYVGSLTSGTHNEWVDAGIARQKEKYPKMQLIAEGKQETFDDKQKAYDKTKELLLKYPDLKGIQGSSSIDAPGAALAVIELGRVGKTFIAGTGLVPDNKEGLEAGITVQVSFWDPADSGYAMNKLALMIKEGKGGNIKDGMDLGIPGYNKILIKGKVLYGQAWVDANIENMAQYDWH